MEEIVKKLREQTGDPKGDFPNMLVFTDPISKRYVMEFCYKKKNANGSFQKKDSYMKVAITYNPWTGEKLDSN